jgi:hypothetical protein
MTCRLVAAAGPKTRYIGTQSPRGVWHIGEAGLGAFPDDSVAQNPPLQSFARFLHSEFDDWWIPAQSSGVYFASSLWWRWLAGVQVSITVFW